ncbi:trypsin-like serine protease [Lentzea sp. NPDC004789]
MRLIRAAAVTTAVLVASVLPASAINSYNAAPAPERTEVGALIATWDDDDNPATPDRVDWVCSGTMIDAGTFLTAAHCTSDWPANVHFFVSLDQDVQAALDHATGTPAQIAAAVAVPGTAHTHPAYPGPADDPHDIAVVEVSAQQMKARWSFTPATLPTANRLGELGPRGLDDTPWLVAGYGTQEAHRGPGGQTHPGWWRPDEGAGDLQRAEQRLGAARHDRSAGQRRCLLRRLGRPELRHDQRQADPRGHDDHG